jgi:histidinol-phosphate phosphatase family protein
VSRRAIFLDRDGTINEEVNYLGRVEDLRWIARAAQAIRLLRDHGWLVVLVTNQSGVGRGYFTEQAVAAIHRQLAADLAAAGTALDGVYCCPHHPAANCACRKPKTLLFERAARDLNIDLAASYAVGDKISDLLPGQRLGSRTVLVLTGHGRQHRELAGQSGLQIDYVAPDLFAAAEWIIAHEDTLPV